MSAEKTRHGEVAGGRDDASVGFGGLRGCKLDRTAWHDGRYRVFVHHLSHRVAQQHDILVKRFDLPLKLDPVDEVDGHRHVLTTELVQKRVLQELAFVVAHDMFRVH